jgi:hypothetical protein
MFLLIDYFLERKHSSNEVCAFERVASICEKGTEFKKTPRSSLNKLTFAPKFTNHSIAWRSNENWKY